MARCPGVLFSHESVQDHGDGFPTRQCGAGTRGACLARPSSGRLYCLPMRDGRPRPLHMLPAATKRLLAAVPSHLQSTNFDDFFECLESYETLADISAIASYNPGGLLQASCRLGYRAMLSVPVKIGERVVGVLSIRTRRAEGISAHDLSIATAFASQAAVALEIVQPDKSAEAAWLHGIRAHDRGRSRERPALVSQGQAGLPRPCLGRGRARGRPAAPRTDAVEFRPRRTM